VKEKGIVRYIRTVKGKLAKSIPTAKKRDRKNVFQGGDGFPKSRDVSLDGYT